MYGGERKRHYRADIHPPVHALLPRGPLDRSPGCGHRCRSSSHHVRSLSSILGHVSQEVPYLVLDKDLMTKAHRVPCPAADVALHIGLAAGQLKSTLVDYCRMIDDFDTAAKLALKCLEGLLLAWPASSVDDCQSSRAERFRGCSGLPSHKNPGCLDQCWCSMHWSAGLERCVLCPSPVFLRLDEEQSNEVVGN